MYQYFYKYQATGNDFVMVDNRQNSFNGSKYSLIRRLCDRRFGIGADGLILISNDPLYDFNMRYFNADGKEASMCGNGGRCAVAFAKHLKIFHGDQVSFSAVDGKHEAYLNTETVKLKMIDVLKTEEVKQGIFMETGSPHYVEFCSNIEQINVQKNGIAIRNSEEFMPGGTNVNFIEYKDDIIHIRTFERGVENETLSCGTGSVAAALAISIKYKENKKSYHLKAPGGNLKVSFEQKSDGSFRNIWLEGPATRVFAGKIEL
ncbi:MAG: diaminopimelate epimerase [Bacteroidales bacterium]|nr:diaminopimelate epimerase [Bacteroidales bacterium]